MRIISLVMVFGLLLSSSFASFPVTGSVSFGDGPYVLDQYDVAGPQWWDDFVDWFCVREEGWVARC